MSILAATALALTLAEPSPEPLSAQAARVAARVEQQRRENTDRSYRSLFAEFWIGSMSDAASTEVFLAFGGQEGNHLVRERWVRLPVKAVIEPAFLAGVVWVAQRQGHYKTARAILLGTRFIRALVFAYNVTYGLRSRGRDLNR
jgi:hypothetical protein